MAKKTMLEQARKAYNKNKATKNKINTKTGKKIKEKKKPKTASHYEEVRGRASSRPSASGGGKGSGKTGSKQRRQSNVQSHGRRNGGSGAVSPVNSRGNERRSATSKARDKHAIVSAPLKSYGYHTAKNAADAAGFAAGSAYTAKDTSGRNRPTLTKGTDRLSDQQKKRREEALEREKELRKTIYSDKYKEGKEKYKEPFKEKSKEFEEKQDKTLEEGAKAMGLSGKKKYEVPENKLLNMFMPSTKSAQSDYVKSGLKETGYTKKNLSKVLSDMDKEAEKYGITDDTVLENGQTYAEYRESMRKKLFKEREQLRTDLHAKAEEEGVGKLSAVDLYKTGNKVADEFADYLIPYGATAKGSLKAAEGLMKLSKGAKNGKKLVEFGEKGVAKLSKEGKIKFGNELKTRLANGEKEADIIKDLAKKAKLSATATNIQRQVIANAMQDASIGTTIDALKGKQQGLEGKEFAKYMGVNAALNAGFGAPMSAVAGKVGKAGKASLNKDLKSAINNSFVDANAVSKVDATTALKLQAKKDKVGLTPAEETKLAEVQTKVKNQVRGVAEIDSKGRLVANDGKTANVVASPQEIRQITTLKLKQSAGVPLTSREAGELNALQTKIGGAYEAVQKNALMAVSYARKLPEYVGLDRMESAANWAKLTGDEALIKDVQNAHVNVVKQQFNADTVSAKLIASTNERSDGGLLIRVLDDEAKEAHPNLAAGDQTAGGARWVGEDGQTVIYLDPNATARKQKRYVLFHEFGHHTIASKNDRSLIDTIKKMVGDDEWNKMKDRLDGEYSKLKEAQARGEVDANIRIDIDEETACELFAKEMGRKDVISYIAGDNAPAFGKIRTYFSKLFKSDPDFVKDPAMKEVADNLKEAYEASLHPKIGDSIDDAMMEGVQFNLKEGDGYGYAPKFYSKMYEIVDTRLGKGKRIGADEHDIKRFFKKKGASDEEYYYSGMGVFLNGRKSVTKEELLDWLRANSLELKERRFDDNTGADVETNRYEDEAEEDYYEYDYSDVDVPPEGYEDPYVDIDVPEYAEYESPQSRKTTYGNGKFKYAVLPNGENYRELVYTMPEEMLEKPYSSPHWDGNYGSPIVNNVVLHSRIQDFHISNGVPTQAHGEMAGQKKLAQEELARKLNELDETRRQEGYQQTEVTLGEKQLFIDIDDDGVAELYIGRSRFDEDYDHFAICSRGTLQKQASSLIDDYFEEAKPNTFGNGDSVLFVDEIQSDLHNDALKKMPTADGRGGETVGYYDENKVDLALQQADSARERVRQKSAEIEQLERSTQLRQKSARLRMLQEDYNDLMERVLKGEELTDRENAKLNYLERHLPMADNLLREADNKVQKLRDESDRLGEERHRAVERASALAGAPPKAPYGKNYVAYALKNAIREAAENGQEWVAWTTAKQQSKRWSAEYAEGYRIEYDQDMVSFMNKYVRQWDKNAKVEKIVLAENGEEVWAMHLPKSMIQDVLYKGQSSFMLVGDNAREGVSGIKKILEKGKKYTHTSNETRILAERMLDRRIKEAKAKGASQDELFAIHDDIRKKTGYFKMPDGNWAFEINDSTANLKMQISPRKKPFTADDMEEIAGLEELQATLRDNETKRNSLFLRLTGDYGSPLLFGEVVKDAPLFKKHPEYRNMQVKQDDALGNVTITKDGRIRGNLGEVRDGVLYLNANALNEPKLRKSLKGRDGLPEQAIRSLLYETQNKLTKEQAKRLEDLRKAQTTHDLHTGQGTTLGAILDHENLFKAYPWLKNIKVSVDQTAKPLEISEKGNVLGLYGAGGGGHIYLNPRLLTDNSTEFKEALRRMGYTGKNPVADCIKSTILHEVQHEIQTYEHWASGANPSRIGRRNVGRVEQNGKVMYNGDWILARRAAEFSDEQKELDDLLTQADEVLDNDLASVLQKNKMFSIYSADDFANAEGVVLLQTKDPRAYSTPEEYADYIINRIPMLNRYRKLSFPLSDKAVQDAFRKYLEISHEINDVAQLDTTVLYEKTVGEQLARKTQERRGLTAEERAESFPYSRYEEYGYAEIGGKTSPTTLAEEARMKTIRKNTATKPLTNETGEIQYSLVSNNGKSNGNKASSMVKKVRENIAKEIETQSTFGKKDGVSARKEAMQKAFDEAYDERTGAVDWSGLYQKLKADSDNFTQRQAFKVRNELRRVYNEATTTVTKIAPETTAKTANEPQAVKEEPQQAGIEATTAEDYEAELGRLAAEEEQVANETATLYDEIYGGEQPQETVPAEPRAEETAEPAPKTEPTPKELKTLDDVKIKVGAKSKAKKEIASAASIDGKITDADKVAKRTEDITDAFARVYDGENTDWNEFGRILQNDKGMNYKAAFAIRRRFEDQFPSTKTKTKETAKGTKTSSKTATKETGKAETAKPEKAETKTKKQTALENKLEDIERKMGIYEMSLKAKDTGHHEEFEATLRELKEEADGIRKELKELAEKPKEKKATKTAEKPKAKTKKETPKKASTKKEVPKETPKEETPKTPKPKTEETASAPPKAMTLDDIDIKVGVKSKVKKEIVMAASNDGKFKDVAEIAKKTQDITDAFARVYNGDKTDWVEFGKILKEEKGMYYKTAYAVQKRFEDAFGVKETPKPTETPKKEAPATKKKETATKSKETPKKETAKKPKEETKTEKPKTKTEKPKTKTEKPKASEKKAPPKKETTEEAKADGVKTKATKDDYKKALDMATTEEEVSAIKEGMKEAGFADETPTKPAKKTKAKTKAKTKKKKEVSEGDLAAKVDALQEEVDTLTDTLAKTKVPENKTKIANRLRGKKGSLTKAKRRLREFVAESKADEYKIENQTPEQALEDARDGYISKREAGEHLKRLQNEFNSEIEFLHSACKRAVDSGEIGGKLGRKKSYDELFDEAQKEVEKNLGDVYARVLGREEFVVVTPRSMAESDALLQELIRRAANGDETASMMALKVEDKMDAAASASGHALQLQSYFLRKSPEGRLRWAMRQIKRLNEEYEGRLKEPLELTPKQIQDILGAKSAEEVAKVMEDLSKELWSQIPAGLFESLNQIRHWAMLFNPKTHGRNMGGNSLFWGARMIASNLETTLVNLAEKSGALRAKSGENRVRQAITDAEEALKNASTPAERTEIKGQISMLKRNLEEVQKSQRANMGERVSGREITKDINELLQHRFNVDYKADSTGATSGRWQETKRTAGYLYERSGNKVRDALARKMNWLIEFNYQMLEKEDMAFFYPAYRKEYIRYCKAKGICEKIDGKKVVTKNVLENMDDVQKEKATSWALEKAKEATFRDDSALSSRIISLKTATEKKAGAGLPMYRLLNVGMESLLPFVKTPVNILRRGIDYSPIGLGRGLAEAVVAKDAQGFLQGIHYISTGLTGTGVLALGVWAASHDWVTVKAGDVSGDEFYDREMGYQDYSIKVFGKKYSASMDWAAPLQFPFFQGAAIYYDLADKGWSALEIVNALEASVSPMLEMSFMSSAKDNVQSFFERAYFNADGDEANWTEAIARTLFGTLPQGWLSGFVPQLSSQLAGATDDYFRDTTSTDKNVVKASWESFARKMENRIPGLREQLMPKVNRKGEDVENKGMNVVTKWANAFANPANIKKITVTKYDKAVIDTYNNASDDNKHKKYLILDLMGNPSYDLANGGRMTYKKRHEYMQTKRTEQWDAIKDMVDSKSYKDMTPDMRADEFTDYHYISTTKADAKVYGDKYAVGILEKNGRDSVQTMVKRAKNFGLSNKKIVDAYAETETLMARSHNDSYHTVALAIEAMTKYKGDKKISKEDADLLEKSFNAWGDKVETVKKYMKGAKSVKEALREYSDAYCSGAGYCDNNGVKPTTRNMSIGLAHVKGGVKESVYRAGGYDWNGAQAGGGLKHYGYSYKALEKMETDALVKFDKNSSNNLGKEETIEYIESIGLTGDEAACVFEYLAPSNSKNPYGTIKDWLKWGDEPDEYETGYGRRGWGRGGYGGGGWGGGGSGSGSGTMPTTASGAIKGKITNPFSTSNGSKPSNLDDAYRKRVRKLREASRK